MAEEPEAIRQQMTETRAALSEKLETLEHQVVDSVHSAKAAVDDTVTNVKDAVQSTVETVKDSVRESVECIKDALDIPEQVNRHPWLMFGGAVTCGYLTGRLLLTEDHEPEPPSYISSANGAFGGTNGVQRAAAEPEPRRTEDTWLRSIADRFEPELNELKGLAIGSVFALVRDLVQGSAPSNLAPSLGELTDRITRKLGGQPIAAPDSQSPAADNRWGESMETTSGRSPAYQQQGAQA